MRTQPEGKWFRFCHERLSRSIADIFRLRSSASGKEKVELTLRVEGADRKEVRPSRRELDSRRAWIALALLENPVPVDHEQPADLFGADWRLQPETLACGAAELLEQYQQLFAFDMFGNT